MRYWCNNPYVVFMQGPPQRVGAADEFRVYFGAGGTYVGTAKVAVRAEVHV